MLAEIQISEHGEETLERIISEAERMFAAHGYKGVAMSQLADACAISKPALYYYFRDKQELYTQVLLRQLARHSHEFQRILMGKSMRPGLRALTDYLLTSSTYDMNQMQADMRGELDEERRALLNQVFLRDFFGPVKELFASGVRSGELRPETDAEISAWMFMSIMSTVCNPNGIPATLAAGRTLSEIVVKTLLDGLGNQMTNEKELFV